MVWWRRGYRAEVATCGSIVVLFLWLNASLVDWQGGWAMGPRYLIPAIPFLVVLAGGVLAIERLRRGVAIPLAGVVTLSAVAMLVRPGGKPAGDAPPRRPCPGFL